MQYNKDGNNTEQPRVMWTVEEGLLDNNEVAAFYSKLSELKNNKYQTFQRSQDGEYIFEVGKDGINNKLVYTDGAYDYPEITKVISIDCDNNTLLSEFKEWIYDAERSAQPIQVPLSVIEAVQGKGTVSTSGFEDSRAFDRQIRGREGTDSRTFDNGNRENVETEKTETEQGTRFFDALNPDIRYSKETLSPEEAERINERNSQLYESLRDKNFSSLSSQIILIRISKMRQFVLSFLRSVHFLEPQSRQRENSAERTNGTRRGYPKTYKGTSRGDVCS
ncbi:MAG: hypothetical protein J5590_05705 [Clostridia bacterium]|nr:hypothetical protein [Clostridia bacterium]